MSDEFIGGLQFKFGLFNTSPSTYKKLESLIDIAGFGETYPAVKSTNFDSTAQEFIVGLKEGNEFTVTANRTNKTSPNVQDFLLSLKGQKIEVKLIFKDTAASPNRTRSFRFQALALSDNWGFSMEDVNKLSFSFKISGAVTMTLT